MQRKRILLVEHNRDERAIINDIFIRAGHRAIAVDDEYSALAKISSDQYDLVVSNLDLPQMSGIELLSRIKEINAALPVILISSRGEVTDAVEAMKRGADDFILKPLTPEIVKSLTAGRHCPLSSDSSSVKNGKYEIITNNMEMNRLLSEVREIAESRASVFISGESGTGKEMFARYIHQCSARKEGPFIAVNCAALPETLMESELFGYEKGAFTGASARKKGKFEAADRGTFLLDEISEMDYRLQSKLLRVLQEKEIDRVGGIDPIPVDVRIIATTNRDIEKQIQAEKFREDLYYRLNTVSFHLPSLRERIDDVPVLAQFFVKKYSKIENRVVKGLTENAIRALTEHSWKGNVREMENVIERAVLMCKGDVLDEKDLSLNGHVRQASMVGYPFPPKISLKEIEKKVIFQTLDRTNGNRTHAAEILGISVRTLRNKLNEYRQKMEIQ